jgi:hypothetical protein
LMALAKFVNRAPRSAQPVALAHFFSQRLWETAN